MNQATTLAALSGPQATPRGMPGRPRRSAFAQMGRKGHLWDRLLRRSLPSESSSIPSAVEEAAPDEIHVAALFLHRRLDLVRLAVLLVDDLPTAEDVVQDAFAAVLRRHGHRLSHLDDPAAYLRTSVVNAARSVLRRRRTARAYIPEREGQAPPAEELALIHEEHQEVFDALAQLTVRQREVLVLRYWSDLTEAQIADTLGLSRGAIKSTASRALDALSRHLGRAR